MFNVPRVTKNIEISIIRHQHAVEKVDMASYKNNELKNQFHIHRMSKAVFFNEIQTK